ncbi:MULTISPECIES: S-layer family protein [unclassified Roseibium]|uniref:beta strand repeat-containing protein n=1 Tax=unclassified Roseibium TaxID=2629323 RepID=UPI00273F8285|nr:MULTISPECIES: hypothetical protein [unclassified Roseibium]
MAFSVNTTFDSAYYLSQNPDVAAAIEAGLIGSAEEHYNLFGFSEGRDPNPYFDTSFYLEQNPDVAAAGINPFDHFIQFGEAEGRAPNAIFDPAYYLAQNPDVAASGMSPFLHFINNGAAEGRAPNASVASQIGEGFDESAYLGANPDVAAAIGSGGLSSGYQHWLLFGFDEGREGAQNLAGETLDQPSNDGTPADNPDDSPADPDAPGAPGGGGGGGGAPADTTDPVFTSGDTFSVEENTTIVGTVVATDNAAVTYTITGGEDAAAFNIDGTTGALSFNTAPDFENPTDAGGASNEYLVEVTATDAAGNTATQDIEVTVEDITVKNVRTGENYTSIQDAIDAAVNGDELLLDGQTFTLPATLNVNKEVTITGAGEGETIIDAGALESYGVLVEADNVTIQDLTIIGPGVAGSGGAGDNYGIKVQPDTGDASDRLLNFTLEDVTVQGSLRTEIDFNGVDGATLRNVTADGQGTGGNGISLTDSANIVLEDITTTGNTWGSVAIYSYQNFYDQTPSNITFQGTYTAAEDTKIYSQTGPAGAEIGTINFNAVNTGNWQVLNSDFRAGGEAFVFYFATDAEALAFGIALNESTDPDNSASAVKGPDGKFHVFDGLSVQAAIDAAEAGDTIVLAAGVTFDEDLNINKSVTIEGANVGIAADGVRGAESNITGRVEISADGVTVDGVQFAPAGAVPGPDDNLITVTGANATLQNLDVDLGRNTAGEYLFGIVLQGEGATVQNSSIDRTDDGINTTGLDRSLIRVSGLDDVTIDGNELINGNIGASLGGTPTDVNITNNTITPSTTNVEAIWVVNAGTLPAAGLDLSGNTFTGDEGIQVQGSDQGDTFSSYATDKNDLFIGKDGSDFFVGGGGDDDLRGEGGTDIASYSGNQADYKVTFVSAGIYTVEHLNGGADGTDTLTDIEFLRFADTPVPVAIDAAVVITVAPSGADYDSIQDAINAAPEGATIQVAAGTYSEDVTLNVNGVTLVTSEGAEIDGNLRLEANNIKVDGFTLDGPGRAVVDRGIEVAGGDSIEIANMTVSNFLTGASLDFASALGTPTNVTFSGNTFTSNWAGIGSTENVTGLVINGNTFDDNIEAIGLGGGVGLAAPAADIAGLLSGNTFTNVDGEEYAVGDYTGTPQPLRYLPDGKILALAGDNLQTIVDAAPAGSTIILGEGTFTGDLTIDKTLTIEGANAGTAGSDGGRGTPSVIEGRVQITENADGTKIDGVDFDPANGVSDAGGFNNRTVIEVLGDSVELTNLVMTPELRANGDHLTAITVSGDGAIIENNLIDREVNGTKALSNVLISYRGVDNIEIDGNTLIDGNIGGLTGDGSGVSTGFEITNNVITASSTNTDSIWITGPGFGALPDTIDFSKLNLSGNTFNTDAGLQLRGTETADDFTAFATDQNDLFFGNGGNDIIVGGAGTDTAIYSGAEANYLVLNNGDGSFTITDTVGDEGSDTLIGIEQLRFSDGTSIL